MPGNASGSLPRAIARLAFCVAGVIGPGTVAQANTLRICVSQVRGTDVPPTPDFDAIKLAKELAGQKLRNGTIVEAVLSRDRQKDVAPSAGQSQCTYSVTVWRHAALNRDVSVMPAMPPGMDGDGSVGPTRSSAPPERDQDTVDYVLRDISTGKVLSRGAERQPTIFGRQGHREYIPYPSLAKQIAAKLERKR